MTGPLKQWISVIVVELLYDVGYPISRNGVVITIGQYQMLVADACSGPALDVQPVGARHALHVPHGAAQRRCTTRSCWSSILPIAFAANIVRVIVLVLITYHFGDEAGQGFLHGAAGIVLMLVALVLLLRARCACWLACFGRRAAGARTGDALTSSPGAQVALARAEAAQLRRASRRHGRHHVGRELLLHREGARRVVVDRRDAKQQRRRGSVR